ncbi:hypothetical protein [Polymorphospora lycopeni]|uniref:PIN domain-containing protein n=1 Tax=Polymorphospora lycopeni TaxID=3140240 RepID=A0ABV5CWX2_9ACTN
MAAPWTALVAVADTNVLLQRACHEVRSGPDGNVFRGLTATGRSRTFVAAHVPAESVKYLPTVADKNRVRPDDAAATLREVIMPAIPVVDLPIRDFLHPRVRPLLSVDPSLPKRLRGDPDDAGTAALAEFLAPTIILSADTVFERLGITAAAAVAYVETARTLIRMAGFEASLADTVALVNIAVRAAGFLGTQAVHGLRQHPFAGAAIMGAMLWLAYRFGCFKRDRIREGLRQLGRMAGPVVEAATEAAEGRQTARDALRGVEPHGPATVEQAAARHLARHGRQLTPSELRDQLRISGIAIPATALKRAMRSHPAFIRAPGELYGVGAPMLWHPISLPS